jgi:CDP-diacylglycerol--glycerol-3-phosphate 3-phosphatidyltransferase
MIPLIALLIGSYHPFWRVVCLALFLVASFSDLVDGYLARRYGAVSDIGKLIDPMADKIMVMAVLVMLVGERDSYAGDPYVPPWLVTILLAREFWISGLRGVAASKGVIVAASEIGKLKVVLQIIGIALLLFLRAFYPTTSFESNGLAPSLSIFYLSIPLKLLGLSFLILSVAFSYISATLYTFQVFKNFSLDR